MPMPGQPLVSLVQVAPSRFPLLLLPLLLLLLPMFALLLMLGPNETGRPRR